MAWDPTRSFLRGRTPGQAVIDDQRATLEILAKHHLLNSHVALKGSTNSDFHSWMTMRGAMLAGGLHRVRLTGGRSIDR